MQNENDTVGNALDPSIEAVSTAPQAAPPDVAPSTQQAAPAAVSIPQSAFAKLKEEQRQRGKREAMSELEAKFKAAGFGSLDDALAALASTKQAPAKAAPAKAQQQQAPRYEAATDDRQITRIQRERERLAKMHAQEQARARKLQRQLEAKEAEMALREAAVSHGVKDVDYALRLLQRELDGKTEAELAGFDERAFFGQKLRSSHPYLFGETVVPATTGTGSTGPTAPKAAQVQAATGSAGQFNARAASHEAYQAELRRRGLSIGI